jgi:hypothetical protein
MRSNNQSRCASRDRPRLPPIGKAAAVPVDRCRCDHFTTLETLTPNNSAVSRHVRPNSTDAATRSRRSFE